MTKHRKKKILLGCGILLGVATYFLKDKLLDPLKEKAASFDAAKDTYTILYNQQEKSLFAGLSIEDTSENGQDVVATIHNRLNTTVAMSMRLPGVGKCLHDFRKLIESYGGKLPEGFDEWTADLKEGTVEIDSEVTTSKKLSDATKPGSAMPLGNPDYVKMQSDLVEQSRQTAIKMKNLSDQEEKFWKEEVEEAENIESRLKSREALWGTFCDAFYALTTVLSGILLLKFECEAEFHP